MASFGGTFDVHGATPQFRLDGFPEEEEEGVPIARSVDQLLLIRTEDRLNVRIPLLMRSSDQSDSAFLSRRPYLFSPPRNISQVSFTGLDDRTGNNDNSDNRPTTGQLHREQSMAIRYRLFNRLNPGGSHLLMPSHVIPTSIFSILPFDEFKDSNGKQSSLVTIFSIWNTMVGTRFLMDLKLKRFNRYITFGSVCWQFHGPSTNRVLCWALCSCL